MRIHSLEHEPFEGLANIEVWAKKKGHSITRTLLFKNEELPEINEFDWLFVMGGSMNIYEEEKYPWLASEKNFIVSKNKHKEIGWFPVTLTKEARISSIVSSLPQEFTAFHWHSDTFSIPSGALRIAKNKECANQAFEYGRTIGLQFHLEYSRESIDLMFKNCMDDINEGKYVQKPDEIVSQINNVHEIKEILNTLLDNMEREYGK